MTVLGKAQQSIALLRGYAATEGILRLWWRELAGLPSVARSHFRRAKDGGEGGIRTHVPLTRQDAFEAPPLRPLRYLSAEDGVAQNFLFYPIQLRG